MRKLTKDGNSLHIAPPRTFLHHLGLLRGDLVELVLDESKRRFYVTPFVRTARTRRPPSDDALPLEESR